MKKSVNNWNPFGAIYNALNCNSKLLEKDSITPEVSMWQKDNASPVE